MQIDRHDPVGARRLEQVGDQPCRDRFATAVLLVLPGVRIERHDRGDPLGAAPLERVDHDQLFHQPLVHRRRVGLQDERVTAAHRLVEAHEDLAVGELPRRLRGDVDVEFLGDLLGEFGMRAAGEEHQIFAIIGPVVAHRAALAGDRDRNGINRKPIVRSEAYRYVAGLPVTEFTVSIRLGDLFGPSASVFGRLRRLLGGLSGRAARPLALHPVLDVALRTGGNRQRAGRDVLAQHGARAGVGAVADGHRRDEHGVRAGAHVRADGGALLGRAVVVDEHAGRADVAVLADVGVADVGQVRHLGAGADGGVLGLDERAELAVGAQHGAGPQVRERAYGGAVADRRRRAVGADHRGAVADGDVGQGGVRADGAATADLGAAEQLGSGVDDGVAADRHVDVDPGGGRIDDGDAGHLVGGDDPAVELGAQLGQLDAVVDAGHQRAVVDVLGLHGLAVAAAGSR